MTLLLGLCPGMACTSCSEDKSWKSTFENDDRCITKSQTACITGNYGICKLSRSRYTWKFISNLPLPEKQQIHDLLVQATNAKIKPISHMGNNCISATIKLLNAKKTNFLMQSFAPKYMDAFAFEAIPCKFWKSSSVPSPFPTPGQISSSGCALLKAPVKPCQLKYWLKEVFEDEFLAHLSLADQFSFSWKK